MRNETLYSEIARLKTEINEEENKYFDGIKNNQMNITLRNTKQKIEILKQDLEQKIKRLSSL